MSAFNIQEPNFSKEKVIELIRLILRIISSHDGHNRVIWIQGDDQDGKMSFANYIKYLLDPVTREIALDAIKKVDFEAISIIWEDERMLRSYRGVYDIRDLQIFETEGSENITIKDNTIYSFYETPNKKTDWNDDLALMRVIDKVSSYNNCWLIWLSSRLSSMFDESEEDRRAIKIRDHEAFSVIRLEKHTDF